MKDSKQKKAKLLIIYYLLFFLIHYFHWVFKNIIFILEQLLRETERFLYETFILEKNEDVKDQVFIYQNKNHNEKKILILKCHFIQSKKEKITS